MSPDPAASPRSISLCLGVSVSVSLCFSLSLCFCLPPSLSVSLLLPQELDVERFEELFKTKAQGPAVDLTLSRQKLPQKTQSKVSLLEANRAKNLAITLRKAGQGSEVICRAIHT